MLYSVMRLLVQGFLRLYCRLRVVGLENVPGTGPALLAANHVSLLDPPAVGATVRRPLDFLAKAELFRVPLLGGLVGRLNAHPVDREGADAGALRLALALLRKGRALLVFPEGTRGREGSLAPGRPGVGMLAALAGVPVVPVYVRGTGRVLPRGAVVPRPVRVTVAYGPPIRFEKGRGRDRYQAVSDEIMAAIGRLKAEMERGDAPGPAPSATRGHTDRTARGPLAAGQLH